MEDLSVSVCSKKVISVQKPKSGDFNRNLAVISSIIATIL